MSPSKNLNRILNGWFSEVCPMWPGSANSFEIDSVLYSTRSRFQQIDVYQTRHHGRMLVLDGIVQLTEFDEFAYQEMLAHLPLFAHPNPAHILVIGGGDGGVLREIERHSCVRAIDFCEIDEAVIETAKHFLPGLACGFDDPRVSVHIQDGNQFIQDHKHQYDVIIVDSSDPIGPAEALFEEPFYQHLRAALKPGGMIATQGESIFLHADCITNLMRISRSLFSITRYANILVPTYPGGHIGVCMGSTGPEPSTPNRSIDPSIQSQLRYYNKDVHKAAFVLPQFARQMIEPAD